MDHVHQIPLSLRWEHKAHWPALRKEFGGSETASAIILALVKADGPVSYSRNRNFYSSASRYRTRLFTYTAVTKAVDHLSGCSLIDHDKVAPGHRHWQSSMSPTSELVNKVEEILENGPPLAMAIPSETIQLRDINHNPVDYRDSPETRRMRNRLREINEAIRFGAFTGVLPGALVRIFNRTFNRGGRFYALGGSWQSMSQEARKQITIGGEPVVEIDYKTLHPAILYAQAGVPLPDDCYNIDGWPRPLVKKALLILLNASTQRKARGAIANDDQMAAIASLGSEEALKAADELIRAIKSRHFRISHAFHSDRGAELMRLDSDLAESVMHLMMMAGVVVLPVHDSFLVQQSQAAKLEEIMLRMAYEAGFEAVQVTRS